MRLRSTDGGTTLGHDSNTAIVDIAAVCAVSLGVKSDLQPVRSDNVLFNDCAVKPHTSTNRRTAQHNTFVQRRILLNVDVGAQDRTDHATGNEAAR